jgi:hypothetical protein
MQALHDGNILVPIALFGWVPVIMVLFAMLPVRRAALIAFLAGWMFLPVAAYEIKFFPEYGKGSATCLGILAATLIFDTGRITRFRPHWVDLFPIILCISPFLASMSNGLGPYDGFSAANNSMSRWLFPYLIGRLYFTDLPSMRELVFGIFVAGLVYVPFCLFEIRMSPNLHYYVYGFHPSQFLQAYREGGFRPVVFMSHGLMTSMFMGMATLCGFGLWLSGSRKVFMSLPMPVFITVLAVTTVVSRSAGALALMLAGIGAIVVIKYMKTVLPVIAMICVAVAYVLIRGGGLWDGKELVDVASIVFGSQRAASLETRIVNENALAEKARQRVLFGWGGWGRNRVTNEQGQDASITDGLWIGILGTTGIVGLAGFMGTVLLPAALLVRRVPPRFWMHPMAAPCTVAALVVCLWMLDSIPNAMFNPIYIVAAGGLAGLRKVRAVQRQPVRARDEARGYAASSPA